ncbi:MAG TPA: C2 domain-containing protein [Blastocatellia bacterium]
MAVAVAVGACGSGEREAFDDFEAAVSRAQSLDARASSDAAMIAYQEVIDAATRYLDQYPDGGYASDVRSRQEKFAAELRSMREEISEYQKNLKKEINEAEPQLPSDCRRMSKMWDEYTNKFPRSKFADSARQKKSRWEAKLQEEIARGFVLVLEDAQVRPVKGSAHGWMAGHTWDPEIFGASAAPDPYALLLINGKVEAYTQPIKDSFHPVWKQQTPVLHVSDDQDLTIAVRDRDVAEKVAVLLMGKGLFTFSGIMAATAALKEDHDDDICKWTGTIRELMDKGAAGLGRVEDCEQLKVKVTRPK